MKKKKLIRTWLVHSEAGVPWLETISRTKRGAIRKWEEVNGEKSWRWWYRNGYRCLLTDVRWWPVKL